MGLTASLEALVAEHDRIGSPLRSRLGPGRSAGEVTAALERIGLTPSDEIIELYAWHEVRDAASDRSRIDWFWPAAPLTLDEAVDTYRSNSSIGEGALSMAQFEELARSPRDVDESFTGFWRVDWLPVLYGHEEYAAACGVGRGADQPAASPMWRVMFQPDTDFPTMQVAPSLTAFIDRVVEMFRLGAYEWNTEYQSLEPITEVFERAGLDVNARPWPSLPGRG